MNEVHTLNRFRRSGNEDFKEIELPIHIVRGVTIMTKKNVEIKLENGLEARPVALLVQTASQYESAIYIESGSVKVNAKSIMGMMTLVLQAGENVVVSADGKDEEQAVVAIENYLSDK